MRKTSRPRGTLSAIAVATLYVGLVLGAPLLVRYGPQQEMSSAVARIAIEDVATPRCAYAPEFGRSCVTAAPAR